MVQIGVESENGWRPADLRPGDPLLVWKTVPGTENNEGGPVNVQVMRGLPECFIPAWLADWNDYIEPLRDRDTAAYTDGNSVFTSNHKNATATDADWENNPFQQDTWPAEKKQTVHEMVEFWEGWMFWAGDWDDPIDQMHSQLGYNTWNRNTAALDFISRKIRSDGKSTFRRGPLSVTDPPNHGDEPTAPTPVTPTDPSRDDPTNHTDSPTEVLYDAVPVIDMDRAAELLPAITAGLAAARCITIKRIAEYLAQTGYESDGYQTTEEYASGAAYEGRDDLGNTEPGDGVRFKGRTWIQITGRAHYHEFGQWAAGQGLVDDPDHFVNNPTELADLKWAGIGAAWYWTVARPQINDLADAGDLYGVTRAINGGTNGLTGVPNSRTDRYNQALALDARLRLLVAAPAPVPTDPTTGGPLMALTDAEQNELLTKTREIWDQLRGPDGNGWPQLGHRADGSALTPVDALATLTNPPPKAAKAAPKKAP